MEAKTLLAMKSNHFSFCNQPKLTGCPKSIFSFSRVQTFLVTTILEMKCGKYFISSNYPIVDFRMNGSVLDGHWLWAYLRFCYFLAYYYFTQRYFIPRLALFLWHYGQPSSLFSKRQLLFGKKLL